MKRFILALSLSACFLFSPTAHAQDKPKPAETEKKTEDRKANEELRMQVVFTESDGDKKISSLPYTLVLHTNGNEASLRVGLRVPVLIGSSYPYMDVGTNLDGNAW